MLADAVSKFKTAVGIPSCAGPDVSPWCTIDLSEADCKQGMLTYDWNRELAWVTDDKAACVSVSVGSHLM